MYSDRGWSHWAALSLTSSSVGWQSQALRPSVMERRK
uniref:DNA-repair protein XRCC4 n=1 Tax=Rhizophora mucronata TaxID=61149 RepID=A0A2P2JVZ9_RHIMU